MALAYCPSCTASSSFWGSWNKKSSLCNSRLTRTSLSILDRLPDANRARDKTGAVVTKLDENGQDFFLRKQSSELQKHLATE